MGMFIRDLIDSLCTQKKKWCGVWVKLVCQICIDSVMSDSIVRIIMH